MNIKAIAEALKLLSKTDPKVVEAALSDEALGKAATLLTESQKVADRWESGHMHTAATREEIKVGPQAAASGDGAEKMVARYSEFTPQMGAVLVAEQLSRALGPVNSSMKALHDLVAGQAKILKAMTDAMAKADDEEEEDDEESEVVEINEKKAKSLFKKAKAMLAKAEDEDDRAAAKALKKSVGKLLGQARGHARLAANITLDKSIRKFAEDAKIKADVEVVQEEEEDEDEEAKANQTKEAEAKALADAAAAKAKEEAEAAAKAKADAEAAAKAAGGGADADTKDKLQKALDGLGMLTMTVNNLMGVISGQSKLQGAPNFVKAATPDIMKTINDRILDAETNGILNFTDSTAARDIVSKLGAAQSGQIEQGIVVDRIAKSTPQVQAIFADLAKAA